MSLKRFLPYLALAGGLIFVVFAFASRVPANGTGPEAPTPLPIAATSLSPAVQRYKGFDEAVPLILSRLT